MGSFGPQCRLCSQSTAWLRHWPGPLIRVPFQDLGRVARGCGKGLPFLTEEDEAKRGCRGPASHSGWRGDSSVTPGLSAMLACHHGAAPRCTQATSLLPWLLPP